jgi:hypothetical protein
MQDDRSVIAGQLAANRERRVLIEAAEAKASQPIAAVGEVEWASVAAAKAEEADALEAYRVASGSNPNIDRRPLHERRADPMPNEDHPDGRNWTAAKAKARTRLLSAKAATEQAHAAHEAAMKPGWDAADADAYAAFAAGGDTPND